MINRIWLHHFGAGIVPTPDDFGMMSEPPSHPELLDYLAMNFMTNGWNIKKIHRLIMLSSVYQESSAGQSALCPDRSRQPAALAGQHPAAGIRAPARLAAGHRRHCWTPMYMAGPVDLRQNPDSTRRTIYDLWTAPILTTC
jgi:hypothetical protein